MFGVSQKKEKDLLERMERLGIREEDLFERFVQGSGRGGRKLDKSMNCVYLRHLPTGIEVKCAKTRSQALNRFFARRILVEKIEAFLLQERDERSVRIQKINKQKLKALKRTRMKLQAKGR